MANKIKFIARDPYAYDVCPRPYPASKAIPQWWKDAKPYTSGKFEMNNGNVNTNFIKCTPMLDALTSGYIFPLWSDVYVKQENGLPNIQWRVSRDVFAIHGKDIGVEVPNGYSELVFKYCNLWYPRLPKGYSLLVTSPFGYRNLPFMAIPAIIDADSSPHELNPPLFLRNDFEGIIEKGTPMFQITLIKRNNWISEFDQYADGEYQKIEDKEVLATIVNNYVKNFWNKKSFK